MQSHPASLGTTQREVFARRPEVSLYDAYTASSDNKTKIAQDQLQKAIDIYDAAQNGQRSEHLATPTSPKAAAKQDAALNDYVSAVNKTMATGNIDRATNPNGFTSAIRSAYRGMIEAHGIERVNPAEHGGAAKYDDWFKVYNKSFPIRGERETKQDMRELLSEPMTKKGYGEIALGLRDPLTGKYAGGVQGLVVSEAAAGMFTYAFLDPAYQGFGLSHTLLNGTRQAVSAAVKQYNPKDTRNPAIFLEKNKLSGMPLENIVLDSAAVNVLRMPRAGDALTGGAISQSQRDNTWSKLGAKELNNVGYIQPSLDGVTDVKDAADRKLAVRYLQEDSTLSAAEKEKAAKTISTALGNKAAHCPLALCTFADNGATATDLRQTQQFLSAFYQTSVLDTSKANMSRDIFVEATMGKLAQQADAKGQVPLVPIKPYAGPIEVATFAEAEQVTRALVKVAPIAEVKAAARGAKAGKPEVAYSTWLGKYESEIRAELGGKFAPAAKTASRPGGPGNQNVPQQRLAL